MKTIGVFVLFVVVIVVLFAARGPSENAVDIAQAQSVIEAARAAQDAANAAQVAAQGISDVGRGQTLILLLLTLMVVVLISLAVYPRHPAPDQDSGSNQVLFSAQSNHRPVDQRA